MTPDLLAQLLADRQAKRLVVLATNLKSGRSELLYPFENQENSELAEQARLAARADKSATVETAAGPVFLNVFNPRLRMILVGAVHIAQALAPMARLAGWEVLIVDPRRAWATPERFPDVTVLDQWPDDALAALEPDRRTAIVTLTHDPKLDDPALGAALRSDAFYIGALGSTRTHAKRLQRLQREGFGPADFNRIHGPIGLDIGAKSPAEIAVAILAQVTETLRRPPRPAATVAA